MSRRCGIGVAFALLVAGCGGAERQTAPRESAKIAEPVAERLAAQSETIAERYEAGDVCGAARDADALVRQVRAAIDAGQVPARYREQLIAAATQLQVDINCPPPAPPPPAPQRDEDEEKGKGDEEKGKGDEEKGKGEDKGKGRGDRDGGEGESGDPAATVEEGGDE